VRLFVAVNLPADVREAIYDRTAGLRELVPRAAWVRAEHLHLTVRFLGEVEERRAGQLAGELGVAVGAHSSFALTLAGIGAFPNFRRPRVVWIGVEEEQAISAVAADVERVCRRLGFGAEERAFNAHVTLARVRRELSPSQASRLEASSALVKEDYEVSVTRLDLMMSELSSRGPSYEVLSSLPLADESRAAI
jgi:2'-5' RNA ligase